MSKNKPTLPDNGRFEQVETEFGDRLVSGSDYGANVRVLLRSEKAVLFVARGLNLWSPRRDASWHNLNHISWDRVTIATLEDPKVREQIVAKFGEGADDAAMVAWRTKGLGTVLVDGGGEPMPLPRHVRRVINQTKYSSVTPTFTVDLTGSIATCRQCGENLQPDVDHHRLGRQFGPDHPRSLEDCQKLTNQRVVKVRGVESGYPEAEWVFVGGFDTWDSESLIEPDFCNARCAAIYGRRAAQELPPLPVGGSPKPHDRKTTDFHDHAPNEPRILSMPDGRKIRL